MILNCVVIDDDPEALNQITSHIKRTPTLQLIGAYTSAREAVRDVRNGHVDVLYLAIQLPTICSNPSASKTFRSRTSE